MYILLGSWGTTSCLNMRDSHTYYMCVFLEYLYNIGLIHMEVEQTKAFAEMNTLFLGLQNIVEWFLKVLNFLQSPRIESALR